MPVQDRVQFFHFMEMHQQQHNLRPATRLADVVLDVTLVVRGFMISLIVTLQNRQQFLLEGEHSPLEKERKIPTKETTATS